MQIIIWHSITLSFLSSRSNTTKVDHTFEVCLWKHRSNLWLLLVYYTRFQCHRHRQHLSTYHLLTFYVTWPTSKCWTQLLVIKDGFIWHQTKVRSIKKSFCDPVNMETCNVHNLLQPCEVSHYYLFVFCSTNNLRNCLFHS